MISGNSTLSASFFFAWLKIGIITIGQRFLRPFNKFNLNNLNKFKSFALILFFFLVFSFVVLNMSITPGANIIGGPVYMRGQSLTADGLPIQPITQRPFPSPVYMRSLTADKQDLFPQFISEHPCGTIGVSPFYWQRCAQPITFSENHYIRYLFYIYSHFI